LKRVFADVFQTGVPVDTSDTEDCYLRIAGCVENGKGVINAGVNIKNYAYGQFICAFFVGLVEAYRRSARRLRTQAESALPQPGKKVAPVWYLRLQLSDKTLATGLKYS